MGLYASDPELIKIGAQFLQITAPFHIIMATISVLSAVLRATGKASLPMLVGFLAIACNTGLNYLLIFGNFGAPKMGVDGAAIATLISKIVECSVMLAVIYLSGSKIAVTLREFIASFNASELRLFLRQSLPLVLNEGVWAMGIFAFTIVYGHMGTTELASITLLGPIEGLSIEIFIGFTSAASIFISTALGARQFARAQHLAWVCASFFFAGALFVANAAFNNLGRPLWSTGFNWARATLGTIPLAMWGAQYGPVQVMAGQGAGLVIFGTLAMLAANRLTRGLGTESVANDSRQ